MAELKINRGAIEATDFLSEVPENEWRTLLGARRSFVRTHLPYDCRELLRFVDDGQHMYATLGYADVSDFVRRGLEIDPELVEWAIDGLRTLAPDEPVAFDAAVARGKAQALAADPEVKALGESTPKPGEARNPLGIGGKSGKTAHDCQVDNINLSTATKGGTSAEYLVRRLKRDAPEVAEELARGELPSARAAAIKAGIVKVPTRVERAIKLVRRMSDSELYDFEERFNEVLQQRKADR